MGEIPRYDYTTEYGMAVMDEHPEGDYVRFEDHQAAILAERNRNGWSIEVDDGVLVARQDGVSISIAAETAIIFRAGSGLPATKEPLDEFFPEKVLALLAHPSSPDHKNTELRNEALPE